MEKLDKLLNFIERDFLWQKWIFIWNALIDRYEIDFFLENNLDLEFILKIRYFLNYFNYNFRYNRKQLLKDFNEIKNFLNKNNINWKYYWFKEFDELVKEFAEKKEKEKIKDIEWYIYIIKSWQYYKIWKTINIKNRISKYITENPNKIELIYSFKTKNYSKIEEELHKKFENKKHNREWFKLTKNDLKFIKNNYKDNI